ncbi:hypothetical protein BZA77DRAFT_357214 [Pyronema omphalodes]|nr:hypothetical protein BZA77DRAFT_357214 [Pyronema omphalodes]
MHQAPSTKHASIGGGDWMLLRSQSRLKARAKGRKEEGKDEDDRDDDDDDEEQKKKKKKKKEGGLSKNTTRSQHSGGQAHLVVEVVVAEVAEVDAVPTPAQVEVEVEVEVEVVVVRYSFVGFSFSFSIAAFSIVYSQVAITKFDALSMPRGVQVTVMKEGLARDEDAIWFVGSLVR